ncbi:hypothetical protein [Burkholderia anthina]|uniref:hypothetical protein n=1 Tax=Burkholderia anthina TaxID=179879 RepID=UPI0037BF64A6
MTSVSNTPASSPQQPWGKALHYACLRYLRVAFWGQSAATNDVIESQATELVSIATDHAHWALEQRGDWEVVLRAIDYMAATHDGPWQGRAAFETKLQILIELAVPNTCLDEAGAAFLSDIQQGVGIAYQSAPIDKSKIRVTDEVADMVKLLTEAACEFGLVMNLLELCENTFHGEVMTDMDHLVTLAAATAAPFARAERKERKIDGVDTADIK